MTASTAGCHFVDNTELSEDALPNALMLACIGFELADAGLTCRGDVRTQKACSSLVAGWVAASKSRRLSYDASCIYQLDQAERDNDAVDLASPERVDNLPSVACDNECQFYSGTAGLGEPCERFGRRMSTCNADLACGFDDRCHDPCKLPLVIPIGGPCGYAAGLLLEQCEDGAICEGDPGTCIVAPEAGTTCDPDQPLCRLGEWCDPTQATCMPTLPEGTPCTAHVECASMACDETCLPPDPYRCGHYYY